MNNLQPNNKANHWMISLGAVAIPEQFYVDRNPQIEPGPTINAPRCKRTYLRNIKDTKLSNRKLLVSNEDRYFMEAYIEDGLRSGLISNGEVYSFVAINNAMPTDGDTQLSYSRFCHCVGSARKYLGIPLNKSRSKIVQLFDEGYSVQQIRQKLNMGSSPVRLALVRNGRITTTRNRSNASRH